MPFLFVIREGSPHSVIPECLYRGYGLKNQIPAKTMRE